MARSYALTVTLGLLTAALALAAVPAQAQDPAFDSESLSSGEMFTWTPEAAGTYAYHCEFHSGMTAKVIVTDGDPGDAVNISIEGFAFSPANITVTTGTQITWANLDNVGHTVTADGPAPEDNGSMEGDGSMEGNGSMEGDDGSMDNGSMEGDDGSMDNGSMEGDDGSMDDGSMEGDDGSMDGGSMEGDDGARRDDESQSTPAPGLLAVLAVGSIAAALVARRRA